MYEVSFRGYYMNTPDGLCRPATVDEIKKMVRDSRSFNDAEIAKQRQQMEQILKGERDLIKRVPLKMFFEKICKLQLKYEEEFNLQMCAIINDSNNNVVITVDVDDETKKVTFYGHGVGDNCYEYAMNDYYECQLMRIIHAQRETQWNSNTVRAMLPKFLNPNFSLEWPVYLSDFEHWRKNYGRRCFSREGMKEALIRDANAFGITCTEIEYDPDRYVAPPGTMLICAILGYKYPGSNAYDYHFYHYHPEVKLWSHKPGITPVTCFDADDKLIKTPAACKHNYPHAEIVGFFRYNISE